MGLLENLINNHYRQKYMKQKRPMRKLHPSTIGMCQRKIVFDMMMLPKEMPDPRIIRVFENGHSMHDRYENLFDDMGILVEKEMKLEADGISGHTDALIRIYSLMHPEGEYHLVELKSAFSRSFEWMVKNNRPKNEHRDQLTFYMHLSGVKKGIIFVENKDTQELWEYHMDYDPELARQLEEKANYCIEMARVRKAPPIPKYHTPSYYKCNICDYNFYCHAGSITNEGKERYPIPFNEGSQNHRDATNIIHAIQNNLPVPDVIEGDTNGDLAVHVHNNNQPQDLIAKYINTHN